MTMPVQIDQLSPGMRQALRDGFDAVIARADKFERALQQIATGSSGEGAKTDLEVCKTIARQALGLTR